MAGRTFTGIVKSNKADKTIVVIVQTRKTHPLYRKQYTDSRNFMAHDEKREAGIGDTVVIAECRPLSANKRFTLKQIVERAPIRHTEPEAAAKPEPKENSQ
ncbi:MAG TPA: 30S ribosomal protein S17 [Candidatus Saccharimonadales bacterium]|nr:30S ribosomal protein S17 [Candidatus Saccharimonadales bacterium]